MSTIQNVLSSDLLSENVNIKIYKTIISLFVLYGCETVCHVRGIIKNRVFENRVIRRIFVPKGNEVTGGWIKVYIEKLHNLYSPNIIRMTK
jgi:hypothetical protein